LALKFSQKFAALLSSYQSFGYRFTGAKANTIVYWKNENNDKESKIILPEPEMYK
jgi:ATP-dependent DNA helicase RecQ